MHLNINMPSINFLKLTDITCFCFPFSKIKTLNELSLLLKSHIMIILSNVFAFFMEYCFEN